MAAQPSLPAGPGLIRCSHGGGGGLARRPSRQSPGLKPHRKQIKA